MKNMSNSNFQAVGYCLITKEKNIIWTKSKFSARYVLYSTIHTLCALLMNWLLFRTVVVMQNHTKSNLDKNSKVETPMKRQSIEFVMPMWSTTTMF